ncbi:hypothetical protein Hypma_003324 [Hypsizygus marmoreus]|uniref:Uncharacterized protein n=1 Tax=Hypsizygus marmoreus TaxID=39966 RepID=A0A369J457_HYPMA|nr:hypothetical protein Hypma_003324 [Hypsizygus marmoreus]
MDDISNTVRSRWVHESPSVSRFDFYVLLLHSADLRMTTPYQMRAEVHFITMVHADSLVAKFNARRLARCGSEQISDKCEGPDFGAINRKVFESYLTSRFLPFTITGRSFLRRRVPYFTLTDGQVSYSPMRIDLASCLISSRTESKTCLARLLRIPLPQQVIGDRPFPTINIQLHTPPLMPRGYVVISVSLQLQHTSPVFLCRFECIPPEANIFAVHML